MLIWRLHFDEPGIMTGRSKCPKCKKTLSPSSLIPIFSWIFQRGRCKKCGKEISAFYPLVEITFATTFYFFAEKFITSDIFNLNFLFLILSVFLILILFFYDLKYLEVDHRISFPAILIAILWTGWKVYNGADYSLYLIGCFAGFMFYFLQFWGTKYFLKREGVGQGDFELGALMGLLLGWKLLIPALFISYIIGSFIAIPLWIFDKKTNGQSALPMGAFLMPALLIFLYNGQTILNWYWSLLLF
jgi:prepilin signal peptidase PulO-like enzyme (type II secretory pathway)